MRQKMLPILLLTCLALNVAPGTVSAYMLNPYAPHNAVGAEPDTPYKSWDIPDCSRTDYLPCPTCGPESKQLPDIPPMWQPIAGPFNIPVPVP